MKKRVQVIYSGIEGSFADIAARKIFPMGKFRQALSFREAYSAVEEGKADVAVLPIENSYAGEVGQVTDLIFSGTLYVHSVYELKVEHCLVGLPDAKLEEITEVYSHPQAIEQCDVFLRDHDIKAIPADNTAVAAKKVSRMGSVATGAIASADAASLYGLKVLAPSINESVNNTTRFAVLTKNKEKVEASSFIMLFTLENKAGALANAIEVIGKNHGFNMRVIRSRPIKKANWAYYFYVEADGDPTSAEGKKMLKELEKICLMVKVVGRFTPGVTLN